MPSYADSISSRITQFPMCFQSQTAAGTGDNTEVTPPNGSGLVHPPGVRDNYMSGAVILAGLASVASTKTLTLITIKQSDSADGTTWGSDVTLSAYSNLVLVTGATTAATWSYRIPIVLRGTQAYVRFKVTLDLSAASTDTNVWSAVLVAYDSEVPAP